MSRTVRWQALLIGLGMALAGILLTYLALTYTTIQVPAVGGTYVEGIAGTPHYINPLLSSFNEADQDICALIFNGLTRLNSNGEVEPDLAQNWEISLDGLVYVFHLKTNVQWHDGTPFTADDVLFTIRMLQDPDYPGSPDIGALWQMIQAEKEDDYTLRFTLSETFAPFIDYTTIGILPAHLMEGVRAGDLPGLEFNLNPVGTGPFRMAEVEIIEGEISSVLLERSPYYRDEGPLLEHIRVRFYPSYQAVFNAFEAGEVDGVGQVLVEDLAQAEASESLALYSAQMARHTLVLLNLSKGNELPFFQEAEVRQALLYGLDRQRMVEQVLQGRGIVAHSPLVAGTWAYDDEVEHYRYDPELARLTLDEAGWAMPPGAFARNKSGTPLAFNLLTSADPIDTALAEEIARQWNELGLQVTVVTTSSIGVRQALEQRNYEAALANLALPGDPDPYPLWHQTQISVGQNYAGLNHRGISEVIETARIIVNPEQRAALYSEFQERFTQEAIAILLYHPVYTYGVDRKIQGVQIGPLMHPSDRFRTANQWYIASRRIIVSQAETP